MVHIYFSLYSCTYNLNPKVNVSFDERAVCCATLEGITADEQIL